ncbi:hypothetical protein GCL60_15955 [Silvanigrella paludirubra]|uniref:Tetratricopeptide repeat protein n=1 Tax=Silvanigrella paludirubra TaxID=2499159 RepID=A0A6N6VNS1_9BACT|nr:hypothetical protein [Silvanigrella paludirubra]KAB8036277.1 hypothetical protein GCL60_15955 [Silvanigrella paludirubra]
MFIKKIIFLLLPASIISGCQSYTQENQKIRQVLYSGKFAEATAQLDESSLATESRNYALFTMEKGMLLYLQGDYTKAINQWQKSDRKLDDLYTTSISKTTASFIVNDSMSDYTGEAHERFLIPIFSSVAFFANNDQNNSLVMVRRTNDIKKALDNDNEGVNLFKYDAFSNYFSGMVFETKGEWDNAIISYKNALNNIKNSSLKSAETQISKDLARLAEFRNRNDILNELKKNNPNLTWQKQSELLKQGEVYIIYESGNSPVKTPKEILFPTDKTVVRVSFPEYKDIPYKNRSSEVFIGQKSFGKTIIMEDIGKMAKQALEDRRVRDIAKIAARVIAKDLAARKLGEESPLAGLAANVFSVATETADTRSWTTLPDTIQVLRVPIIANKETAISIKPEFGSTISYNVKLSPGEKKLIRFRTFN